MNAVASQSRLFGRATELESLSLVLRQVVRPGSGSGGAVALLGGNSGVGKTAVAQLVMDQAEQLGFDVHRIACEPFHEGMSFFPVRELVRQLAHGRPVGEAVEDMFGSHSPQAEMAAVSESVTADPASRREALVATFTNVIFGRFRMAAASPTLLFIDDLEHLDAGSADALICLISRIKEGPVVILGAFRSDLVVSPAHPLRSVVTSARRAEGVLTSIDLNGFDSAALDSLVEVMLEGETDLPAGFYDKLYRETEGNPLFIREVLRTLRATDSSGKPGPLNHKDGKWTFDGPIDLWAIPPSVEDVIATRLDLLDPEQRNELEFAAVVGRRFAFEVLNTLMESEEDDLLCHLERFLSFDLIRELNKNDDTFEFSHGKIRDVLYDSLSGLRRRRIHAQVASVFSKMVGTANEDWDALIGEHLFQAAKLPDAFPFLLRAARNAQRTGSARESVALFKKAYVSSEGAVLLNDDSRETIQLELACALISTSETAEAGAILEQLVRDHVSVRVRIAALNYLGDALLFDGDVEQALSTYRACEDLASSDNQIEWLCEVACDLAELHGRQYERHAGLEPDLAKEHQREYEAYVKKAYNLLPRQSRGALRARVLRNKAKLSRVSGDLMAAEQLYRESIECVDGRVSGHRFLIPYAKTLRLSGKGAQALEIIDRILAWSAQVGSRRSEAIAWQYRSMILMMMAKNEGELNDARSAGERALKSHRLIRYAQGVHETEMILGEVALRLGSRGVATAHFESSVGKRSLSPRALYDVIAGELDANGEHDRASYVRLMTEDISA